MTPGTEWFGDSYDLVKRHFVGVLKDAGYRVYVEPMFTGDWEGKDKGYYHLIGAGLFVKTALEDAESALLIDPDTGIGRQGTDKHITVEYISRALNQHGIVVVFDQSFSRQKEPIAQMKEKLERIAEAGRYGFYYNSHARFLFAGQTSERIEAVKAAIERSGVPTDRLIGCLK